MCRAKPHSRGFTLIELLVVVVVIGILLSLLVPVLNAAKHKAALIGCMNNQGQLSRCLYMYTSDYNGIFPPNDNFADASVTNSILASGLSWCPDQAQYDTTPSNLMSGLLYKYNTSVGIYHCPADFSTVIDQNTGLLLGMLRFRSYNMSQSINGFPEYQDPLGLVALIPSWKRVTDVQKPSPSQAFVWIDEHKDSLRDAEFGNPVGMPFPQTWFDKPSDRHSQGAVLVFVDGHTERWHWKVPKIVQSTLDFPSVGEQPDYDRVQHAMKQSKLD